MFTFEPLVTELKFKISKNCKVIHIEFQVIEEHMFSGLIHVVKLYLNKNLIRHIEKRAFITLKGSVFQYLILY